jgi:hypothetical protein
VAAADPERAAPTPQRVEEAGPERPAPAPKPVVDAEPETFTARAVDSTAAAPEPEPEPAPPAGERAEVAPAAPAPPDLLVAKTLWHPQADRRVAFVSIGGGESRRIQEGDVVGRYVVSEIQPSGVVFLDDGEKVRRAVGAK